MPDWQYTKGLHELGNGTYAYLLPDGGWGWSNAGLITDGGESLLVDTLFDLPLTAEMLTAMRDAAPAAKSIDTLVNTHANGDHTYGNQLVKGAENRRVARLCRRNGNPSARRLHQPGERLAGNGRCGGNYLGTDGPQIRFRRYREHLADQNLRPRAHAQCRQQTDRTDQCGPGTHQGRRDCPRAGRPDCIHRRHRVRRRPPGYVGRPGKQLDRRLRSHSGTRCRDNRARPRANQRQGRECGRYAVI